MQITNSLIRIINPSGILPPGFESVRRDLNMHVMELPVHVELPEWESHAMEALKLIEKTVSSGGELVLFVGTSGSGPAAFSPSLVKALAAGGGALEHYAGGDD